MSYDYDYYAEQQEQERYNRELDREFERNQRWEEDHRHNMLMWEREQEQYRNSLSSRDDSYSSSGWGSGRSSDWSSGWSSSAASDDGLNAFVMVGLGFLALWLQTLSSTLAVTAAVILALTVVVTKISMSRHFLLNIPLFLIGLGGKVVALQALWNWLCSIF